MSADHGQGVPAQPRAQRFRRAARENALSAKQKRRQATITDAAWRRFGAAGPVIAFLNSEQEELGGRPLDVALGSDQGMDAVLGQLLATSETGVAGASGQRGTS